MEKKTGGKKGMKIVTTTTLPWVDRPNADRWNTARSCQYPSVWVQSNGVSVYFYQGQPKLQLTCTELGLLLIFQASQNIKVRIGCEFQQFTYLLDRLLFLYNLNLIWNIWDRGIIPGEVGEGQTIPIRHWGSHVVQTHWVYNNTAFQSIKMELETPEGICWGYFGGGTLWG